MTKEEAIKYLQQLYPYGGHCWLDEKRIEAIGMAVSALKKEPVSKDKLTFTSLPRLLDRIKPTDRAKWYSSRLADALEKEGYITDAKIVRESIKLMNGEKVPMATMDEESVSEDLEKAATKYAQDKYMPVQTSQAFKAGANWQKEKDESTTEDLSEYINELSKQFQEVSFAKLSRIAVRVTKWHRDQIEEALLSEVLPCFMHGGEADEVVAKLDEVLKQK